MAGPSDEELISKCLLKRLTEHCGDDAPSGGEPESEADPNEEAAAHGHGGVDCVVIARRWNMKKAIGGCPPSEAWLSFEETEAPLAERSGADAAEVGSCANAGSDAEAAAQVADADAAHGVAAASARAAQQLVAIAGQLPPLREEWLCVANRSGSSFVNIAPRLGELPAVRFYSQELRDEWAAEGVRKAPREIDAVLTGVTLEQWFECQGRPGNYIKAHRTSGNWGGGNAPGGGGASDHSRLVNYPSLSHRGIILLFYSQEFKVLIVMRWCDLFRVCPAGHVWPYCAICGKFEWPCGAEHHRSAAHQKKLRSFAGSSDEDLVAWCGSKTDRLCWA
jgi:hypothetical protein